MKIDRLDALQLLPGPPTAVWPDGARFARVLQHGTMSVEIYAPEGRDPQQPHSQDELYVVVAGNATLVIEGERYRAEAGDVLFVRAGRRHNFVELSHGFAVWAVFWGPPGGEQP